MTLGTVIGSAMVLARPGAPLVAETRHWAAPGFGRVLVKVCACGVCRTDLHVMDGEIPTARYPIVPGHEVVGRIIALGQGCDGFRVGDRVGIPWLGGSCGTCEACRAGRENLCPAAVFVGAHRDGGYAEYIDADSRYCFRIPEAYADAEAAPLLCAGLIGYRALRKAGPGERLGLYGFGAAAHIVIQIARHERREVFAFARPGDEASMAFARELGATWAGPSDGPPPAPLDAAVIFAPVGALVPQALKAVRPGGRVVCAGIHMSDIPAIPYALLWGEREIVSVANLTRQDGEEFLALAPTIPIRTATTGYALADANRALADLRQGRLNGAAVLQIASD
ncbi:zinc-dependent alcohol dehydrogenase family protein [Dongia sp. agr-C8]